ncbi:MAG: hypothetical protein B7Z72_01990 [Gemmatimonadetes bacterium 21-71-4]|nr:MAG: hypothetical protein B7Z72_01990 [Gemmatimonadetes bacterium 21-71-4]
MRLAGVDTATVSARLDAVFARYVALLRDELSTPEHGARAYPGVPELLDALEAQPDVTLGLLTGNVEPGAHAKLQAAGIAPGRFRVGAFGSDHAVRAELPAIARRRASEILGREVPGHAMTVIGDTPADLTCGRGVGARAMGVATGRYSVSELGVYEAAAVFANFRDTAAVLDAILAA